MFKKKKKLNTIYNLMLSYKMKYIGRREKVRGT